MVVNCESDDELVIENVNCNGDAFRVKVYTVLGEDIWLTDVSRMVNN
jgi:hypothetical protein